MRRIHRLATCFRTSSGLFPPAAAGPSPSSRRSQLPASTPSTEQFDLLSLRSFRRDALLQYDATNQSEPLRIALTLLGILFALAYPSLLADTPGLEPADPALTTAGSAAGAIGCAFLFQRNRAARAARIERISR